MEEIVKQRLHKQLLGAKKFETAEETVRWLTAVQGQDYHPTLWALAQRSPGLTKADIEAEIQALKIVRTWTFRRTIHFVTLADLVWTLELSKDRMLKRYKNYIEKDHGLYPPILDKAHAVLQEVLQGKQLMPRPALRTVLEEAGIDAQGQKYSHILWHAAQSGLIFIGPMAGKQQTFGLVAEWAPENPFESHADALKALAVRYLQSHGPATEYDFAWWSGLTVTDARKALKSAEDELPQETVPDPPRPSLYLLEGLDEYFIAYKDRSAVLPQGFLDWLGPHRTDFYHPVIYNGVAVGIWSAKVTKNAVDITYEFQPGIEIELALLEVKKQEYEKFLGLG